MKTSTLIIVLLLAFGAIVFGSQTASAQQCHPSYEGECLQIGAGDYDCAGGGGNGPNFVNYQVRVVGPDEFDLDRDGDGIGCESLPVMPASEPVAVGPEPEPDEPEPEAILPAESTNPPADEANSDVLGVVEAPDAGFGPSSYTSGTTYTWLVAGLIGAGLAWLIAGAARARAGFAVETSNSSPAARRTSLFDRLPPLPPLVRPEVFRRRD